MNIFGESNDQTVDTSGFITNPLTTDLLGAGFNALDLNEVHLNELHDNSGTGKIVVHEELNMTNNKIGNLADPVAAKDAVTLSYYEANFPPSFPVAYDIYSAVSDETTALSAGFQAVTFQATRAMTMTASYAFLTTAAVSNNFFVELYRNGTLISSNSRFIGGALQSTGEVYVGGYSLAEGDRFTVNVPVADPSAVGLKYVLIGNL